VDLILGAKMRASAANLVATFENGGWVRLGVPGFDASLTKTKLGETYDVNFQFLLTEDHRYDAHGAAKQLLEWLKKNRPWRTTALLAVVFDGAHVLDIQRIAPISEAGWYHRVVAGLIDLPSSTYYGFAGYDWLLQDSGLGAGRS
jgi:hypothetical protein